jgi:hypothetical protein
VYPSSSGFPQNEALGTIAPTCICLTSASQCIRPGVPLLVADFFFDECHLHALAVYKFSFSGNFVREIEEEDFQMMAVVD